MELFPIKGRGVTFTCSVAHGEQVVAAYLAAGVSAETLTGETLDDEREAIIERIGQEKTRQLVVIDCASEGFDLPELECATLLRPSASLTLVLQQIARAIRPVYAKGFDLETREGRHAAIQASGKTHAKIIDCVSNTLCHGIPELDHKWSLESQDRKARAASKTEDGETLAVRQCLECYAIHPSAPECPQCGHEHPVKSRIPKARAEELRELEKSERERLHRES
nr:helicase-related protein [Limimaricola variabilis]